jgi:CRISPR/Cas system-associated protein endoribonuclease Cas2
LHTSEESAEAAHRKTVKAWIPPLGQVRLLAIADHQFDKMEAFYGSKLCDPKDCPKLILLL